jgi:hypothetical protein
MVPVLERLAQVDDVRQYIHRIANKNTISYYEAFRILKAPRESSPLDDILLSWRNLKKNAAAFFSGNVIEEEPKEDSKEETSGDDSVDYKVAKSFVILYRNYRFIKAGKRWQALFIMERWRTLFTR